MRISAVMFFVSVAALAACGGGQKTTYSTTDGTATVTKSGKTTTFESKSGKIAVGAVDPSKLGAPIYPGAAQNDQNGAMSVTSNGKKGTVLAAFSTGDKFSAVEAWYKAHMPKGSETVSDQTGGGYAVFVTAAGTPNQTSVTITEQDGKTGFLITHGPPL